MADGIRRTDAGGLAICLIRDGALQARQVRLTRGRYWRLRPLAASRRSAAAHHSSVHWFQPRPYSIVIR